MRLSDFILRNMESILAKWEEFAATRLPAAASMTSLELRDLAQQILEAVAADLSTSQSPEEQAAKSKGLAPAPFPARETAAQTHAVMRARVDTTSRSWSPSIGRYAPASSPCGSRHAYPPLRTCRTSFVSMRRSIRRWPNPWAFHRAGGPGAKPPPWHAQPRYAQPLTNGADDGAISRTAECRR